MKNNIIYDLKILTLRNHGLEVNSKTKINKVNNDRTFVKSL